MPSHGGERSSMASHAYRGGWGCHERLHCELASSAACLASGCSGAPQGARVFFIAALREPASRLASEYFWWAAEAFLAPGREWKSAHGLHDVRAPSLNITQCSRAVVVRCTQL